MVSVCIGDGAVPGRCVQGATLIPLPLAVCVVEVCASDSSCSSWLAGMAWCGMVCCWVLPW